MTPRRLLPALSLALLYNLARTAEMRGRACDAAAAFDEFLASVAPDNVAEARHVEVARASREKARAACPPPPAPASVAVAPSPPTVAADPVVAVPPTLPVPPATPAIVAPLDVAQPEATRTASPWKWVAGAGALGALATGGTLLVIGYGELDDARAAYGSYQDATTDTERERAERDTKSADSSGRLHGTIGYVALGVGAALAGLTVWLFLRDDAAAPGAGVPDSGSASDPAMGFSF